MVPEFADVTHNNVTPGKITPGKITPGKTNYGCGLLVAAGVAFFIAGNFVGHPLSALLVSAVVFAIGAFFVPRPLWGTPQTKEPDTVTTLTENEKIREHRCCIQCRTPTEILR